MNFDFGKRAIKVCKCDGKVTFTIPFQDIKGANPQRVSTEIIIEIIQFNAGRIASHSLIESIWCSH